MPSSPIVFEITGLDSNELLCEQGGCPIKNINRIYSSMDKLKKWELNEVEHVKAIKNISQTANFRLKK